MPSKTERYNFLISMFEQNCETRRQGINERLWFINIFTVIFIGSISILKDEIFKEKTLLFIIPLLILSLFATLITIKSDSVIKARQNLSSSIIKSYGLEESCPKYKKHWVNWISIGRLVSIYFSIWFCLFFFIFLRIMQLELDISIIMASIFFIAFIIFLLKIKYDKDIKEENSFTLCD